MGNGTQMRILVTEVSPSEKRDLKALIQSNSAGVSQPGRDSQEKILIEKIIEKLIEKFLEIFYC